MSHASTVTQMGYSGEKRKWGKFLELTNPEIAFSLALLFSHCTPPLSLNLGVARVGAALPEAHNPRPGNIAVKVKAVQVEHIRLTLG